MTLEEIFKTNPKLLEEPEVQKLIEHVNGRHIELIKLANVHQKFYSDVLEICMYSEIILIGGKTSTESIKAILDLYEN